MVNWVITLLLAIGLGGLLLLSLFALKVGLRLAFAALWHTIYGWFLLRNRLFPGPQALHSNTSNPSRPTDNWIEETDHGLSSQALAFEVHIEQQRRSGQFPKTYVFSRPLAGVERIASVGGYVVGAGRAWLSLDKRYLLIVDEATIWFFDIKMNRMLHQNDPDECCYFFAETPRQATATIRQNRYGGLELIDSSIHLDARGELKPPLQWDEDASGNASPEVRTPLLIKECGGAGQEFETADAAVFSYCCPTCEATHQVNLADKSRLRFSQKLAAAFDALMLPRFHPAEDTYQNGYCPGCQRPFRIVYTSYQARHDARHVTIEQILAGCKQSSDHQASSASSLPQSAPVSPLGLPWTLETAEGLSSPAFNFDMRIGQGSEVQPGSFQKVYQFSRPLAGLSHIECRYGWSQLSPDGRFLLVADQVNIWLFDLAQDRKFHVFIDNDQAPQYTHNGFQSARCIGRRVRVGEYQFYGRDDFDLPARHIHIDEHGELEPPNSWDVKVRPDSL